MRPEALVTGGSRGIGRAICIELAKSGFNVAFTYRSSAEQAQSLEKEISALGGKAQGFSIDIADTQHLNAGLDKILESFPHIEVLVNNAGITIDGLTLRYKLEDFEKLINTNVKGAFITTQALLRPMMKAKKGSIIFISSTSGQMGISGQVAYSSTKAALFGMTKSLAKEVGSRNIRVNAVAPGFIATDMTEGLPAQYKESILPQIPLGKFGTPEDVAKVVAFLASSASQYITGEVLAVNGGLYM